MNAEPDTITDDPVFRRMQAAIQTGMQRLEAQLDQVAPARTCDHHADHQAVLNREASLKACKPVYECARCVERQRQQRWAAQQTRAGIPQGVRHATADNFELDRPLVRQDLDTPAKFVLCARDIAERRKRNAIFAGTVGIGKGHLAAALANCRLRQGHEVLWLPFDRLFEELHATYDRRSFVTVPQIVAKYSGVHLLIIDEMGINGMPVDGETLLFNILDARDHARRQTIATTNMPGPDLKQRIGDRCHDRLHSGGLHFCYGSWKSMRRETSDEQTNE